MTDPVTIVLLGEPVPFAHRQTKAGRRYTPSKQKNEHAALRLIAQQEMSGREPFEGALVMELLAERKIPASWSMKKKNAAILGLIRPTSKPDLDNYIKQAKDALKGVVWLDDAQVVEYKRPRKVYGKQPKLVITVSELAGSHKRS
jgi:Holliday junction resolvase RusA-like endonuclease